MKSRGEGGILGGSSNLASGFVNHGDLCCSQFLGLWDPPSKWPKLDYNHGNLRYPPRPPPPRNKALFAGGVALGGHP